MRVLSPKMLPPERELLGSMASTAPLFFFSEIRYSPRASMKVLFPAPGTPVMAIRSVPPVKGNSFAITFSPFSRSSGLLLSIRVIARWWVARSPLLIRCAKSSTESSFTLFRLNPGFIELSSDLFITSYHHSFSAGEITMRHFMPIAQKRELLFLKVAHQLLYDACFSLPDEPFQESKKNVLFL